MSINFTAYLEDPSQLEAITTFMKSQKIRYEVSGNAESYCNIDFINKIKQGDEDLLNGKGKKVTLEELDQLWK
ncbi:MAG: hypothetical protein IPN86_02850 [Saprospiraceae bacterium]|nr:hypothetical protein [Saprospiraceae bacterium]